MVTEGAEVAGTETSMGAGGTERVWPVMISTATPPPATARQPAAASGLAHRRPVQRRWSLARRRKSSQGSARASSGMAAGWFGTLISAALVTTVGAAAGTPVWSRRARNSSIVRIWSASGSSTTSYNDLPDLLGTGVTYFHSWTRRGVPAPNVP